MTKFTPGPWHAHRNKDGSRRLNGQGLLGIATLHSCVSAIDDEQKANSHLIAAAPDMYEALELAKGYIRDGNSSMLEVMEEALAKARGES